MPSCEIAPFTVGQVTTDPSAAGLLGRETQLVISSGSAMANNLTMPGGDSVFKLVQASSAISCTPGQVVLWTATTGSASNFTASLAGAAATRGTVAGFAMLPLGTTTIAINSYFWVCRRGPCPAMYGAAAVAQTALATVATGNVDDTGQTFDTLVAYSFGTVGSGILATAYAVLG